jgi:hypothetical protein
MAMQVQRKISPARKAIDRSPASMESCAAKGVLPMKTRFTVLGIIRALPVDDTGA